MSWPTHLDSLRRVIEQVELGNLEPAEAEAEAARLGVAPLAITPDPNRFDPHKETHWTILMALAWIMWPDGGQVRELWDSWREQYSYWDRRRLLDGTVHAGHVLKSKGKATLGCLSTSAAIETKVNGNPPSRSVAEAREELWRVLQEGKLKATGIDTTTERRVEIPALDWLELELVEHVQDPSKGDEVRRRGLVFGGYRDVRVPSAAVRSCFPAPGEKPSLTGAEAPTPRTPAKRGGGAPVQYDWEAMIAELVRWADKEGLPKSQRAAGKYLADWYTAKNGGEGPHKNTVRKRLGRYLAHLPEGDDN